MKRIKKKNILFEERVHSNMPIPKEVMTIYDIFTKNGFELYIVGGAVRDTLLNKPIKDYDLATNAEPNKVEEMMLKAGIKTIGVGVDFGVINVYLNEEEYEIATFRIDKGSGRRPDSVEFSDIETDVKRRDLTINALFYDINTKEIVDLVGGIQDIKNGVVRTVGNAEDRFEDDPLRILRALRFAARMGSNLHPDIDKYLKSGYSLEGISAERIRDEFIKGIRSAKSVKHFLSMIDRYGLFDWVFKDIEPINKSFIEDNDSILILAVLLKDIDTNVLGKKMNKLTYSSNEIKQITFLISFLQKMNEDTFYTLKRMHKMSGVSDETFKDFAISLGFDSNIVSKFIDFELSISGDDVMREFGMKPGKEVGDKIEQLETELFIKTL